jgi:hypothetical protein
MGLLIVYHHDSQCEFRGQRIPLVVYRFPGSASQAYRVALDNVIIWSMVFMRAWDGWVNMFISEGPASGKYLFHEQRCIYLYMSCPQIPSIWDGQLIHHPSTDRLRRRVGFGDRGASTSFIVNNSCTPDEANS